MWFLSNLSQQLNTANDNLIQTYVVSPGRSVFGNILNVVRIIGTGLALIMITWMSINYFTADGRGAPWAVERKADIKGRQIKNFAIGVIIFIGASNILYLIATFIADIFGASI